MNNKTLADEIITLITHFANDNPAPIVAEMIREYEDGYIDVRTGLLAHSAYRLIWRL